MKKIKYVYVVSKSEMKVIDTASDVETLKKRIATKKVAYPKDVVFVGVKKTSILSHLATDEMIGEDYISNMLGAAIVAGVDVDTALARLVDKDQLEIIEIGKEATEKDA